MKNQVSEILAWHTQAVPAPVDKNRSVMLGVHIEEFSEMLDSINMKEIGLEMHKFGMQFKTDEIKISELVIDRKELLDSLADQIVTAIGVCRMFGLDIESALTEVNRSNFSKFDKEGKPIFDENGKVKKGPDYTKPNLEGMY